MKIEFGFGRTGIEVTLPPGFQYEVVQAHSAAALPHVEQALQEALLQPVAGPALADLARGKQSAAISVCDITRPAPNRLTLPPLLATLHAAGLKRDDIRLCIATGLHREATPAELDTILSPEIAAAYPVVNHDAKDQASHEYVGTTMRGTPVHVHREFLSADLHLTLGFIEQHLMLGFSGGRKLIAPGLAAEQTIKVIHSPRFMRESRATEGSIDENPLHAELLEIARMVRHDFIVDVTLTREREISGIFAGNPEKAHAAGVMALRKSSVEYLSAPVDAAITSAAGHPLDLTFYQTIKGITAVQHIVKPGGPILAVSECREGMGSHEFAEMVRNYRSPQSFLEEISGSPVAVDQWQLEKLALVQQNHPLLFYVPGVRAEQLGSLATGNSAHLPSVIEATLAGLPPGARVALLPDGPYAYARVRGGG